jgi:hypothetical protein
VACIQILYDAFRKIGQSPDKKDSPSSGLFQVKIYNEHGMAERSGTGMFPREVVQKPLPPLVGRLLPSKKSRERSSRWAF